MTDQNDTLSDDSTLPTQTEGTGITSDALENAPSVTDESNLEDSAGTGKETSIAQLEVLPGAPKNEFEGLKEALLKDGAELDEVTVNVDIIESDENTGDIFHEHTNYDTMVLNHPGGPYLTDVDNARNALAAERRMAQNDGEPTHEQNLGAAFAESDLNLTGGDDANEVAAKERVDALATPPEADLPDAGTAEEVLGETSGTTPKPDPSETVPGESADDLLKTDED